MPAFAGHFPLLNIGLFAFSRMRTALPKTKPPVNWWFAQTLKGFNAGAPVNGYRNLATHHYSLAAAMSRLSFFALFILDTRKRVYVFAYADLVVHSVFLQLLFDIFPDYTFISSYRIDIIPAAPKISAPVLVF